MVVPSRDEVAPRVISEAQVRGLTVVASAVGGIPEQIEHDVAGRLFAAGDAGALASHPERLLGSRDERARLGANARTVRTQRGLGPYRESFRSILDRHAPAPLSRPFFTSSEGCRRSRR